MSKLIYLVTNVSIPYRCDKRMCVGCSCIVAVVWGPWTPCTAECGGGKQEREKFCDGQLCDKTSASCHVMSCDSTSTIVYL